VRTPRSPSDFHGSANKPNEPPLLRVNCWPSRGVRCCNRAQRTAPRHSPHGAGNARRGEKLKGSKLNQKFNTALEQATQPFTIPSEMESGRVFPIDLFFFLPLTRAFRGATNPRKTSSLVVSLLTNCKMQSASEAADLPGRAGLLSRRDLSCNTPPTPGGENEPVFTSLLFLDAG